MFIGFSIYKVSNKLFGTLSLISLSSRAFKLEYVLLYSEIRKTDRQINKKMGM
jgi:hypothetical protein